jgi:hypothetical protein
VSGPPQGPPPLAPFGLVLHHDGRFTHEGHPIRHARLRAAFERGVRWLPAERKFVVQLGRFRGEIEVEEAAFFVRAVDVPRGAIALSDGTAEPLDVASLRASPIDGALLCTVKRTEAEHGLAARFLPAAQAELLLAAEEAEGGLALRLGGVLHPLPELA